jgi:prepilin-type N-terminal cleavage/methylation domain-containing protein
MLTSHPSRRNSANFRARNGFTIIEMLAVLTIVGILSSLLLPALAQVKRRGEATVCISNLRQIAYGFRIFAHENSANYPWRVPTSEGGSKGLPEAWQHYSKIQDEIVTPKVFRCPSDKERKMKTATSWDNRPLGFQRLKNNALSYFAGTDADENYGLSLLAGDRNVIGTRESDQCLYSGNIVATSLDASRPLSTIRWEKKLHMNFGNVACGDGSVLKLSTKGLQTVVSLSKEPNLNNHVLKPE